MGDTVHLMISESFRVTNSIQHKRQLSCICTKLPPPTPRKPILLQSYTISPPFSSVTELRFQHNRTANIEKLHVHLLSI